LNDNVPVRRDGFCATDEEVGFDFDCHPMKCAIPSLIAEIRQRW
jgi:hypothetical protein